jgi:hypothetical protein
MYSEPFLEDMVAQLIDTYERKDLLLEIRIESWKEILIIQT